MAPSRPSSPRLANTRDLMLVAVVAVLCGGTMVAALVAEPVAPVVQDGSVAPAVNHAPQARPDGCPCPKWNLDPVPARGQPPSPTASSAQHSRAQALPRTDPASSSDEDPRGYLTNMARAARDGDSIGITGEDAGPIWVDDDAKASQ